jgi:tetratricopeptide (TPR) repeat protein
MLKFQTALMAVLGTALLVPGLRSQDATRSLERSLAETTRAIEVLAGIQRGIEARHPAAIQLAKQATEPQSGEARVRDNRVVTLRDEVNRLQAMNDRMQGASTQAREVESTLNAPPSRNGESAPHVIVSTGLSEAARAELVGIALPAARGARPAAALPETSSAPGAPKDAGEQAADPLRQAQVLYRAGRYEECAAQLKRFDNEPEAAWWRARALERLERTTNALECYRRAKEGAPKDSQLQKRAAHDLEFLEWKVDFLKKLAPATQSPGAKAKP